MQRRGPVDAAAGLARDAGHPVNQRALELVGETLRAAAGDPDLRERVIRGRVEREQSATTLGTPAVPPTRIRDSGSSKRRGVALARTRTSRRFVCCCRGRLVPSSVVMVGRRGFQRRAFLSLSGRRCQDMLTDPIVRPRNRRRSLMSN